MEKIMYGRWEIPVPERRTLIAAIRNVQKELDKYRGGKIIAHKHSVHKAVVALEQLCRLMPDARQKQKLPIGLTQPWFSMLWASRGWTRHNSKYCWRKPSDYPTQRAYACALRDDFKRYLARFEESVRHGEYHAIITSEHPLATRQLFAELDRELERP